MTTVAVNIQLLIWQNADDGCWQWRPANSASVRRRRTDYTVGGPIKSAEGYRVLRSVCVCLRVSVCLQASQPQNRTSPNFLYRQRCPWPWLGPPLVALKCHVLPGTSILVLIGLSLAFRLLYWSHHCLNYDSVCRSTRSLILSPTHAVGYFTMCMYLLTYVQSAKDSQSKRWTSDHIKSQTD